MSTNKKSTLSLGPAPTAEESALHRKMERVREARRMAGLKRHEAAKVLAHSERASFMASLMEAAIEAGLNVGGVDQDAVEVRLFRGDAWALRGEAWVVVRFATLEDCAGFRSVNAAASVTAQVRERSGYRKGPGARCRVQVRDQVCHDDHAVFIIPVAVGSVAGLPVRFPVHALPQKQRSDGMPRAIRIHHG